MGRPAPEVAGTVRALTGKKRRFSGIIEKGLEGNRLINVYLEQNTKRQLEKQQDTSWLDQPRPQEPFPDDPGCPSVLRPCVVLPQETTCWAGHWLGVVLDLVGLEYLPRSRVEGE